MPVLAYTLPQFYSSNNNCTSYGILAEAMVTVVTFLRDVLQNLHHNHYSMSINNNTTFTLITRDLCKRSNMNNNVKCDQTHITYNV